MNREFRAVRELGWDAEERATRRMATVPRSAMVDSGVKGSAAAGSRPWHKHTTVP